MARPSTCLQPLLGGGGARGRGRGLQVCQGVEAGGPGVEDQCWAHSTYIWTLVYLEDRGLEEDCLVYTEEEEGAHCTPGLTLTL